MSRKLLMALLVSVASSAPVVAAEDFPWVTFTLTDGSQVSVPSDNLEMVYSEGKLLAKWPGDTRSFDTSSLSEMRFSDNPVAVDGVVSSFPSSVTLVDINGVEAGVFDSLQEARENLPSGLYIIKGGSENRKVIF